MKNVKKFFSLLAAAALLVMLPGSNALTASAAEPTTYYIREIDSEWRFQPNATWDDTAAHRELYYMEQDIKDGDIIIIDGSVDNSPINVPVRLSNLTVINSDPLVLTAKGIDNCYILDQNVAAINGDVTNAYVYGISKCNFNSNVTNLEVIGNGSDLNNLNATVAVLGTVSHLKASDSDGVYFEYYNFPANKFYMENGTLKTDAAYYSTAAPSGAPAPTAQPSANAQASAQTSSKPSSGDYDEVPKTGDSNHTILLLTGIAAVCLGAKFALKKAR